PVSAVLLPASVSADAAVFASAIVCLASDAALPACSDAKSVSALLSAAVAAAAISPLASCCAAAAFNLAICAISCPDFLSAADSSCSDCCSADSALAELLLSFSANCSSKLAASNVSSVLSALLVSSLLAVIPALCNAWLISESGLTAAGNCRSFTLEGSFFAG